MIIGNQLTVKFKLHF